MCNYSFKTIFCVLILITSLLALLNLFSMSSVNQLLSTEYKVFGRVQGVFFRKFTKDQADKLGIYGWVQNARDGTVIGTIQGPENSVKEMKHWLAKTGSPYSSIDKCQFTNERLIDKLEFSGFTINRS